MHEERSVTSRGCSHAGARRSDPFFGDFVEVPPTQAWAAAAKVIEKPQKSHSDVVKTLQGAALGTSANAAGIALKPLATASSSCHHASESSRRRCLSCMPGDQWLELACKAALESHTYSAKLLWALVLSRQAAHATVNAASCPAVQGVVEVT